MKVFYNFEEIEFRPLNQTSFHTEFLFHLPEGYQVEIPIQLSELIEKDDYLNNLTIAVFANPQYNTVDPLAEWYSEIVFFDGLMLEDYGTGIVSNFAISFGGDQAITLRNNDNDVYRNRNEVARGLTVNPEIFDPAHGTMTFATSPPPSPWRVLPDETFDIPFATNLGVFPDEHDANTTETSMVVDSFLIIGLLNWEQVELSGKSFVWAEVSDGFQEDESIEGVFTLTAPNEPGLYDFVAFAIGNPIHATDLPFGFIAMRFTIEVQ